jgi:hypothetical protein
MRGFGFFWCAALSFGLGVVPTSAQQQDQNPEGRNGFSVRVEAPNGWSLWDDTRDELIVSAGSSQQEASRIGPLVKIYNVVSGERRSIDILKDFPSARFVNVDALAAGAGGSVVVACEVNLDSRSFAGDRVLLYDNHSALRMNVIAADYDVSAVTTDEHGNIYFVGVRDGEQSSDESYPLLVKYSSTGRIALDALPRSLFADFDDPTGDGLGDPRHGATRVAVNKEAIHVYLAPASEIIALSQAGEIRTRVNVTSKLSEFARSKGYKDYYVDGDEFSPSGDLWLVGHLEELVDSSSAALPARNFVVRLTPEGQLEVPYKNVGDESAGYYLPKLIGFTQTNEPVNLSSPTSGYLCVQKGPC